MEHSATVGSRPYHHHDLKREMLRLSRELLAEEGLGAFSVAKLAKRARVSTAAPYRHFADSDALLAAVAVQLGDDLADTLDDAARGARGDEIEGLAATAGAYTRFVIEHGVGLELVFSERFHGERFASVHAASRRIMDILLPLALDASGSDNWSDSLRLLESHLALAVGFATQQRNGSLYMLALSTGDLADHAARAASDLISGFRLRRRPGPGADRT